MSEPLTFAELAARCRRAGLPAPVMTESGVAIIAVPVSADASEAAAASVPTPTRSTMTAEEWAKWAAAAGGWQAAADWLNVKLGTRYTRSDTRRWAHPEEPSHRPMPAKVSKLLTDHSR